MIDLMTNDSDIVSECRSLKRRLDLFLGFGIMVFAAIIYSCTLSHGAYPGSSSDLMAIYTGVEPIIAPAHPIWGSIVGAIGRMGSAANMVLRLNLFSLLLGVLCVGIVYRMVSTILLSVIDPERVPLRSGVIACSIGGFTAAFALAFSVPFWMVSTRLSYQIFDLFVLLCLTDLFIIYMRKENVWLLCLFALLYGICIVETFAIVPFAFLFAFIAFRSWVRRGKVHLGRLFAVTFFGLLGLCFYLLVAKDFCTTQDMSLRGYENFWQVVNRMVRDQISVFRHSIPQLGWLLILVLVILPWLASLAIARRALNHGREWSLMAFHVALTIIAVAVLANAPGSPWSLLRSTGVIPVIQYALVSIQAGYLMSYWFLLIANKRSIGTHPEEAMNHRVGIWTGDAFGGILAAVLLVVPVINSFEANGHRGDFADECAEEILDSMGERVWLISDGIFDNHLRLAAARKGKELHLIEMYKNSDKIYQRQLKKLIDVNPEFDEKDKVRLRNSADLGVFTFVQDWIKLDPTALNRMAFMNWPDLIISAEKVVLPNGFCFISGESLEAVKDIPVLEKYGDFWKRMEKTIAKSRTARDPVSAYRSRVRRQIAFVANNAGVLLEDLGRDEEAYQVYFIARSLDPENISALLNIVELLHRKSDSGFHAVDRDMVEKSLKDFVANMKGKYPIWSLSRSFGYVRNPALFSQLGWQWALSGQPGMAIAGLERAESVSTTPAARLRARENIAEILFQQNEDEKSESIYAEILGADPKNQRALLSMSRLETKRGSIDKAEEWLDRARDAGADKATLSIQSAALDLASSKPQEACIKLTEVTELQPNNLQAWAMLAVAMMQSDNLDEVEERILPKMEAIAGTADNYIVQITRGQFYYQKGRDAFPEARMAFERAAALRPNMTMLLEWVLRLDFAMNDKVAAEEHARRLLMQNRDNGFANYIMGSLMLERGRKAEAEDYLRRSVNESRSPAALNDLAELLCQMGNFAEAEKQVRAAIDYAPDLYVAWDTLGGILTKTKRYPEAEEAYSKALELCDEDFRVHLNYARLLCLKGEKVKARSLVQKVQSHRSELPPTEQAKLQQLIRDLTPNQSR